MVKFKKTLLTILSFLFIMPTQVYGRVVDYIKIEEIGTTFKGKKAESMEKLCASFRPTKGQIRHFFNSAKESTERNHLFHDYYSPCISIGSITFKDGLSGRWTLQSSGLATFVVNGEEKANFFSRANQWHDPFACMYDEPEPGCEE